MPSSTFIITKIRRQNKLLMDFTYDKYSYPRTKQVTMR